MAFVQRTGMLCLLFMFTIRSSYCNSIAEGPTDRIVNAGETVVLPCLIESQKYHGNLFVYWYKSTLESTSSTSRTLVSSSRQISYSVDRGRYSVTGTGYRFDLTIDNIEAGDSDYYYCMLYVPRSTYIYSNIARLDVFDPSIQPACALTPNSRTLEAGNRVTITCFPASPSALSSLTMFKGVHGAIVARAIRSSDRLSYTRQLTVDDRNKPYSCTPSGRYPDINNCTVTPLLYHTITLTPVRGVTELGGDVRFSCVTTGTPSFNMFTWVIGYSRRNVIRLTETTGRYIVSTNGESGRLTITNVQLSDNNTAVRCRAINSLGEQQSAQAKVFMEPVDRTPPPDIPITTKPDKSVINGNGVSTDESKPHLSTGSRDTVTNGDASSLDREGLSGGVAAGNSSLERPQNGAGGTVIAIALSLLVLLVLAAIILLFVRRKQGKPTPRILKRLSVNRPLGMKKFSFDKPRFIQRVSMSKGIQGAQNTIEVVHRRISTLKSNPADTDKRSSLRDSNIEVVVNPPPPEWQFRNVEDVDKMQRKMLISKHAPTGDYSNKEIDLLNSLITGNVKTKTLDTSNKIDVMSDDTCDDDDADSQFESDFEEDDFDDPLSDSGSRAIDPSPRAPPRRKRVKKPKKYAAKETENIYDNFPVEKMDTTDTLRDGTVLSELAQASANDTEEAPVYTAVNKNSNESEGPMYAEVNRDRKSTMEK